MESYQKRKQKRLEEYGKVINDKLFNDEVLKNKQNEKNMLNKLLILRMSKD